MKVLEIMGSPRIGGNSDILLDEALAGAKDTGCGSGRYHSQRAGLLLVNDLANESLSR